VKKWRAVLFDLDDTLYPEREYVQSGFRAVARWIEKEFGCPAEESYDQFSGMFESGIRRDVFNRWLIQHSLDCDAWIPQMVQIYRAHEPLIEPYPDTRESLEQLHRQCVLGLVSDGYLEVQRRKWTALRLDEYFQLVIFSDTWGRESWKPSARPFEEAVLQLSLPAAEMVYVADNPSKDFRGARAVGMGTVRIRRDDGLYRHLEPPTPADAADAEIAALPDLCRLVQ